jgi:hypothetical protein
MEAKDTAMKLEDIERIVNKVLKEHILPLPHDYVQAGYDEAIKLIKESNIGFQELDRGEFVTLKDLEQQIHKTIIRTLKDIDNL